MRKKFSRRYVLLGTREHHLSLFNIWQQGWSDLKSVKC